MLVNPTSHGLQKALLGNSSLLWCQYGQCPLNWPLRDLVTHSGSLRALVTDGHAVSIDLRPVGALAVGSVDTSLVISRHPSHPGSRGENRPGCLLSGAGVRGRSTGAESMAARCGAQGSTEPWLVLACSCLLQPVCVSVRMTTCLIRLSNSFQAKATWPFSAHTFYHHLRSHLCNSISRSLDPCGSWMVVEIPNNQKLMKMIGCRHLEVFQHGVLRAT